MTGNFHESMTDQYGDSDFDDGGPTPTYLDQAIWRQMQETQSLEIFAKCWLILQSTQITGTLRGLIVMGAANSGLYQPLAFWPEGKGGSLGLTTAVELAIQERRGVLRNPEPGRVGVCHIAYPFLVDNQLYGVVALELTVQPEADLRNAMRQLQWNAAWMEIRIRREEKQRISPQNQRLATILDWLVTCVDSERFQDSATALVTEIATTLGCERVSVGFLNGTDIRVRALSHSANFMQQSNLIDYIASAMEEAMDQRTTLLFPQPVADEERFLTRCQARLSAYTGDSAILSVPLSRNGKVIGGLTLERPGHRPFDTETLGLCEAIAAIAGPILEDKLRADQWLVVKAWQIIKRHIYQIIGPGYAGFKLSVALVVVVLVFFSFATGDFRVAADTKIEGEIQRVVSAPLDGYVIEAAVRAGDIVKSAQLMARLDDRDLQLERMKWVSQRQQYLRQYREAQSRADRAEASVLTAQVDQAEAELALVDEKLARSRVLAPFDGVVVSGDLSQSLGAPVARGDVLFEVAPLDAYRVILEVDEADMKDLQIGQRGKLVLTGESSTVLAFSVQKITPVSESRDGRNFFRVEAKLDDTPTFLRPGMKGVGKIDIGERKLFWIWTHKLSNWLSLWFWSIWS